MNPIEDDFDEFGAFVDIAQLMMPVAQPFPSNSVLCVSVWQKRILDGRYDMANNIFLSIQKCICILIYLHIVSLAQLSQFS